MMSRSSGPASAYSRAKGARNSFVTNPGGCRPLMDGNRFFCYVLAGDMTNIVARPQNRAAPVRKRTWHAVRIAENIRWRSGASCPRPSAAVDTAWIPWKPV